MSEEGPVDPGESILRRILRNSDSYDPSLPLPVSAFAFRPNQQDTDGISLFRELLSSADRVAASARKPASSYVVARLKAADMFSLGLSLRPTPGDLPGHVVIPEINSGAYQDKTDKTKRRRIVEWNQELAKLASKDIITNFREIDDSGRGIKDQPS
jgi:hypothetical protein